MQTKVLVKSNGSDMFAIYDTQSNTIINNDSTPVNYEGLYTVTDDGKFGLITDKDKINECLETYRILSDN